MAKKGTGVFGGPKTMTEPDADYLHGTEAEVGRRLEKGLGPTESHFTQIRPEINSPSGRAITHQKGDVRNNRARISHRG